MKFYVVRPPSFWGDYGGILINGMTSPGNSDRSRRLQLERTGPFMPPITFPALHDVIVTDVFRHELRASKLATLKFRSVVKKRIVKLDWETWDRKERPLRLPKSGEPEDYILWRRHSEATAEAIGPIWQVLLPLGAEVDTDSQRAPWDYDIRVHTGTWKGEHFFYGKKPKALFGKWPIVSERGRSWLEEHAGEWVRFTQCLTKEADKTEHQGC